MTSSIPSLFLKHATLTLINHLFSFPLFPFLYLLLFLLYFISLTLRVSFFCSPFRSSTRFQAASFPAAALALQQQGVSGRRRGGTDPHRHPAAAAPGAPRVPRPDGVPAAPPSTTVSPGINQHQQVTITIRIRIPLFIPKGNVACCSNSSNVNTF